ncbi:MAG: DUF1566 domain-containing protein [Burkholderiaceae bacterium]|nr:DUF1566 domain-containing protein [Burkholderiaceae bacterium]
MNGREIHVHRRLAGPVALSLLSSLLLLGCGGGGGGAPEQVTLGGTITGQRPSTDLQLQVAGVSQTIGSSIYGSFAFAFARNFDAGTAYTISIVKHPAGQMCRITQGASGTLSASISNVAIQCSHSLLNDTGIASGPDGSAGRDAEATRLTKTGAGALGFDFTRLCASGDVAGAAPGFACTATTAYPANAWACTRDNASGLVWARAVVAGDAAAPGAQCGIAADGWRRPSVHELQSIVHAGRTGAAAVDADYFPDTPQALFLASDTYLDDGSKPWAVDFANQGPAGKYTLATANAKLRWVAGATRLNNAAVSLLRSAVGSDYHIVDNRRELMWLVPTSTATRTWAQAVDGVAAVNAARPGGHGDWRLPNRHELDALVLRSASGPALDAAVYGDAAQRAAFSQLFWSASPVVPASGTAVASWAVDFSFGDITPLLQTTAARVLYVRDRTADAAP